MRRTLVENARRKQTLKQGGEYIRQEITVGELPAPRIGQDIISLNDGLDRLAATDRQAAERIKLRDVAGLFASEHHSVVPEVVTEQDFHCSVRLLSSRVGYWPTRF